VNSFTVPLNDFVVIKKNKNLSCDHPADQDYNRKINKFVFFFLLLLDNFIQNNKEKLGFEIFRWIYRTLIW